MGTWQVALVRDQGVEFGVVVVQDHIIENSSERDGLVSWWCGQLGRPVALMGGQRHRAYGRRDIVNWLGSIDPSRLPWRQITVN